MLLISPTVCLRKAQQVQSTLHVVHVWETLFVQCPYQCTSLSFLSFLSFLFLHNAMTHIMVWRGELPEDSLSGFWHHGIRLRNASVIHFAGMHGPKTLRNARILHTPISAFACDPLRIVHTVKYPRSSSRFPVDQIERRALACIGATNYHLLFHNCETFSRWCVTGKASSFQAQGALVGLVGGITTLLFGGGLLGAVLTTVVAHKAWDCARNRSEQRVHLSAVDSDDEELPLSVWNQSNIWSQLNLTISILPTLIVTYDASSISPPFSPTRHIATYSYPFLPSSYFIIYYPLVPYHNTPPHMFIFHNSFFYFCTNFTHPLLSNSTNDTPLYQQLLTHTSTPSTFDVKQINYTYITLLQTLIIYTD